MCSKKEKLKFIDSIVELLAIFCPQMSIEVSHFVACQFALESNYGKSRIATTRNNLCGMRVPIARLSNNQSSTGFASYKSMVDCVIDYCYWLAWNHFDCVTLLSLDNFTRKLIAKQYCPDKDYIDSIYSIYHLLKS